MVNLKKINAIPFEFGKVVIKVSQESLGFTRVQILIKVDLGSLGFEKLTGFIFLIIEFFELILFY